jgi:RNA polymerase sigma factor (sigma-70 family)
VDARERAYLIQKYEPLVHRIVGDWKARFRKLVLDDLAQDGQVGLIKAAARYDPLIHKVEFGTYAAAWIRKYVRRAARKELEKRRRERSWVKDRPEPILDPLVAKLAAEVWRVVETLEPIEQRVVIAHFGMIKNGPRSWAAIAAAEHLTESQVRTIWDRCERKIIARLRL